MTPKEKAKEVFNNIFNEMPHPSTTNAETYIISKRCALIAINEMISEVYNLSHQYVAVYDFTTLTYLYTNCKELTFWQEVKQEIEKL